MWKQLLIVFLIVNALFWGLYPHNIHCRVASMFMNSCAPHYVHVAFGVVCFLAAVSIAQKKLFNIRYT